MIFDQGYDSDTITGFQDDLDTIQISSALAKGRTVAQILSDRMTTSTVGASAILNFVDHDSDGSDDIRQITGVSMAELLDEITIV